MAIYRAGISPKFPDVLPESTALVEHDNKLDAGTSTPSPYTTLGSDHDCAGMTARMRARQASLLPKG